MGLAVVFMAPGPWAKWAPVKGLRSWAASWGLSYSRLRMVHRLNLLLTVLVVVHVLWSGPMAPAQNPAAFAVALVWALICLGLYFRSRFTTGPSA